MICSVACSLRWSKRHETLPAQWFRGPVRSKVAELSAAVAEVDRFFGVIAALPTANDTFDLGVKRDLERRRTMLSEHALRQPADDWPLGPCGWTHGDFQYRNLLWSEGRLAAILGWDWVGVRALADEVARTLAVQFVHEDGVMDLPRVAAFTAAYRAVVPLNNEQLVDAVRRQWWRWATDLWPLGWHYEGGNSSCDALWSCQAQQLAWWTEHFNEVEVAVTG